MSKFASSTDVISSWKTFNILLPIFNAVIRLIVIATTYFVMAVYRAQGTNVKLLIDDFSSF